MDDFEVNMYNAPKRSGFLKYLIIGFILAAIIFSSFFIWIFRTPEQPDYGPSMLITQTSFTVDENTSLSDLYENTINSVVTIVNKPLTSAFPFDSDSDSSNIGSGFIVTSSGHIVTNYHVISAATKLTVVLYNGNTYSANVVDYDADLDIAVIKINPQEELSVAYIGDSAKSRTGDPVYAIGTPYSPELYGTITRGIISFTERKLSTSDASFLQTDAAINPGNSGGPLFNMAGEVIGINTSKISNTSVDNLGFAISSSTFKPIVEKIIGEPVTIRLGIGISGIEVSNIPYNINIDSGFIVASVTDGGPADEAGIKSYDIIIQLDGVNITDIDDIQNVLDNHKEGDVITVVILRESSDNKITLSLTLKNMEFYN